MDCKSYTMDIKISFLIRYLSPNKFLVDSKICIEYLIEGNFGYTVSKYIF